MKNMIKYVWCSNYCNDNDNDDALDSDYITIINHTLFCELNNERPGNLFLAGLILRSSQMSTPALNRSRTCGLEICSYNQHIQPKDFMWVFKKDEKDVQLYGYIFLVRMVLTHFIPLISFHTS